MDSDLSRDTFEPEKRFSRVLEQQGRVVLDADATEQTSAPSLVNHGGFAIGIGGDPRDLTIAHGRIDVDGIVVENDADTTLTTQPFLQSGQADLAATGVSGAGLYGVYLDAWERVVTALDDPSVRDTALAGADTSARSKIAWQVKLSAIDTTEFGDEPPRGVRHHYAKLAIVAFDGTRFAPPEGGDAVIDCRAH